MTGRPIDLLIRADGDSTTGTGHVMRMVALAHEVIDRGGRATLASSRLDEALAARVRLEGLSLVPGRCAPGGNEDVEWTAELFAAGRYDWLAVDGYSFSDSFQQGLFARSIPQLFVDDFRHCESYVAELVLNPSGSARPQQYGSTARQTGLLLGPRFALLRREFRRPGPTRRVPERAKRLLVTMGGADPNDVTATVVRALARQSDPELEARVVIGSVNARSVDRFTALGDDRIVVVGAVRDMSWLMKWADLAVASAGSTVWELACQGTPALLIVLAKNQEALAASQHELGVAVNLGWYNELETQALAERIGCALRDPSLRQALSQQGRKQVDGKGASRVADRIASCLAERR